jgi:hypothetical protein
MNLVDSRDGTETAGPVVDLLKGRAARYRLFAETWPALQGPRVAVKLLELLAESVELLAREKNDSHPLAWRSVAVEWNPCARVLELAARLFEVRIVPAKP